MALLELSFADTAALKKEGRNFDCSTCPKAVQKIRRCWEPREDFTSGDGAVFPIYIHKGGTLYGFCPAKVSRDLSTVSYFKLLVICAEMRTFPETGGLFDQDGEFIEQMSWFLPAYDMGKFASRVQMVMGDMGTPKKQAAPLKR